jgi:hypothetical protein
MDADWDFTDPDWPSHSFIDSNGSRHKVDCYHLVPHAVYEPYTIGSGEPFKVRRMMNDWVTGNISSVPHGDQFKSLKAYWGSENLASRVKFT